MLVMVSVVCVFHVVLQESDTASKGGAMSGGSSANNSWTILTPEV